MVGFTDSFLEFDDVSDESKTSTNEALNNSYTASSAIQKQIPGKRIDYILFSGVTLSVQVKHYSLPLPGRVPDRNFSYSDHEAVTATLSIDSTNSHCKTQDNDKLKCILGETIEVCEDAMKRLSYSKQVYWFISAVCLLILILTSAMDPPFGRHVLFLIFKILITCLFCFTAVMGTLWNQIELNALIAGKMSMEINLKCLGMKED